MMRLPFRTLLPLFFLLLAASLALAPLCGEILLRPADLIGWLTGSSGQSALLLDLRIPRAVTAVFAGAGFSAAGFLFQVVFRNDLATPYTLGASSAASLGAYVAILFVSSSLQAIWPAAFLGGGIEIVLVILLLRSRLRSADQGGGYDGMRMIVLLGVMLGYFFAAITMLLRFLASPYELAAMEIWVLGSLQIMSVKQLLILTGGTGAFLALLAKYGPLLDYLAFSDGWTRDGNFSPDRKRLLLLSLAMAMTTLIISFTGPIAFIGLLVPHFVRMVFRGRSRPALILCSLAGGFFLLWVDTLARSVTISGSHFPVGVLTAILGVPLFLSVLLRRQNSR